MITNPQAWVACAVLGLSQVIPQVTLEETHAPAFDA